MPYLAETYTIGDIVRKETEIAQGSTLQLTVQVPGGTAGKAFASTFRHTSATLPQPVGVDIAGAFTVTVLDSATVQLSTPTGTLLPGRYVYDITATLGSTVSVSSAREFVVLQSVTAGLAGPGPLPPVSDDAPHLAAAEDLSALRVVSVFNYSYKYSDPDSVLLSSSAVGITRQAVTSGQYFTPQSSGVISDSNWGWALGLPVFLGPAGTLTQTPPATGHMVVVAKVLQSDMLVIHIEDPVVL